MSGQHRPVLVDRRDTGRTVIAERPAQAIDEGDLPISADPDALAEYLIIVINGLSTRARDGVTRPELRPSPPPSRPPGYENSADSKQISRRPS